MVGTIIELPRAALVVDEIAKEAEFLSFGTNDLAQTTFGFSRDDVNKVLPTYLTVGILKQDPFAALDQDGVGQLVKMATERDRKTRPNPRVGIVLKKATVSHLSNDHRLRQHSVKIQSVFEIGLESSNRLPVSGGLLRESRL